MKISNDDFLQKVWELQLKLLSKAVLNNYVGGSHGVVSDSEGDFKHAISIHTIERNMITEVIGKQQIFKRIRDLISTNHIAWAHKPHTFFIDTKQSKDAFLKARDFWLCNGVPSGWDKEAKSMRTAKIDNYETLLNECHQLLLNEFETVDLKLINSNL